MKSAVAILFVLSATALGADLIASDLPLACRLEGKLILLPSLTRPAALRDRDNQSLRSENVWLIAPPIPYGPIAEAPGGRTEVFAAPSRAHFLGTDDRGRDIAARLVHGTRQALFIGLLSVLLFCFFGTLLGLAAGLSHAADWWISRLIEIGLLFPTLFLLLALQGLSERASIGPLIFALVLSRTPAVARLVRAEALRTLALGHVEAARASGLKRLTLLRRHVLPFVLAPIWLSAAFGLGQAVLYESALGFLGFGVPAPAPSWGELLLQAHVSGLRPWILWPPTIAVAALVWASHRLSDGLTRVDFNRGRT